MDENSFFTGVNSFSTPIFLLFSNVTLVYKIRNRDSVYDDFKSPDEKHFRLETVNTPSPTNSSVLTPC